MFADPQGAVLAMIKPEGEDQPPPEGPVPGNVVWRELLANDAAAETCFYQDLFGWKETQSFEMGPNGTYHVYGKNGRDLGGMMKRPEGYPLAPHFLYYVHVQDLDAAIERREARRRQGLDGSDADPVGRAGRAVRGPAGRGLRVARK